MNVYYAASVAIFILAIGINIAVNRKRFYRRQNRGTYGKAILSSSLEKLGKVVVFALILLAIGMMGKGYQQEQKIARKTIRGEQKQ